MKRVSFALTGMHCAGCEQRVASALRRLDGVETVKADHQTGIVVIDYDAGVVQDSGLVKRLELAGYRLAGGEEER